MSMTEERYELVCGRLNELRAEQTVDTEYADYFKQMADFAMVVADTYERIGQGWLQKAALEELREANRALYADLLGEAYETSYANPAYACKCFGLKMGRLLSYLYTELRAMIPFAYEQQLEEIVIRMELLSEVYGIFESAAQEKAAVEVSAVHDTLYWYVSDYSETSAERRIRTQLDADEDFATRIIMDSDLSDLRYLYYYGEYISADTERMAQYLNTLSDERIQMMADTYTEGYRIGFVKGNKDLSIKETVDIRFCVGFERMVRAAIQNFAKMGLRPTLVRAGIGVNKGGYYGAIPNKQYDYDHKEDLALFFDKKLYNRKIEVTTQAYETYKDKAAKYAGPAVIETFGEVPFTPQSKSEACAFNEEQQRLFAEYRVAATDVIYRYIKGDERSFTIIAFPVPEIGERFEEIFDATVAINTLDYHSYERMQAIMIDTLNHAKYVEVKGMNGNRTDMHIELYPISNPDKEAIFENCVADVNIPVGEVFTSPVLEGTHGTLHVSKVFLNELEYHNLEMTFKDGKIATYTCTNFDKEEENREYVKANVLMHHETLPIGEFAIGTNTTAYMTARKYDIANRFPILIAEKTGPHFAVGDTCYSHSEDVRVYNEDGKEIVAKDNSVSLLRKSDPSKAYFGCHTDITIPYDELGSIIAYDAQGKAYPIIERGRFVLAGCEELNAPLDAEA